MSESDHVVPGDARSPGRSRFCWMVAVAAAAVVSVAACGGGAVGSGTTEPVDAQGSDGPAAQTTTPATDTEGSSSTTDAPARSDQFAATDQALQSRVVSAGLPGGVVLVVRNGVTVHADSVGAVDDDTPLGVASAAKWLTAATLMTYVDDAVVALDDPVSRWLPEFAGDDPAVTVRELLDHTSGVRDPGCLWDTTGSLADCVGRIARSSREFPAGSAFSYGNADFHVIGRLLEVLGGADFVSVFRRRIGGPAGMASTTWPGAPNNPSPAAGARTTVADYSRFLAMILARGTLDGERILSARAVDELVRNQIDSYDTSRDYAVRITGIPRYGLGAWPDVVDLTGTTVVVSGSGGSGFYPWVDFSANSYGIVGVEDTRGAQLAVPASQRVELQARADLG